MIKSDMRQTFPLLLLLSACSAPATDPVGGSDLAQGRSVDLADGVFVDLDPAAAVDLRSASSPPDLTSSAPVDMSQPPADMTEPPDLAGCGGQGGRCCKLNNDIPANCPSTALPNAMCFGTCNSPQNDCRSENGNQPTCEPCGNYMQRCCTNAIIQCTGGPGHCSNGLCY